MPSFFLKELNENSFITHDITKNWMTIWVNHDGPWNCVHDKEILEKVLLSFKPVTIGWNEKYKTLNCFATDWETLPKMAEYYFSVNLKKSDLQLLKDPDF